MVVARGPGLRRWNRRTREWGQSRSGESK